MPGKSGNPSGRRKPDDSLEALCRIHTPEAVAALVQALKNPRERVPAAIALLDRGWGKPVQMVSGDANRPLVVDFKWADESPVSAPQTIEGVVQQAVAVAFQDDDNT